MAMPPQRPGATNPSPEVPDTTHPATLDFHWRRLLLFLRFAASGILSFLLDVGLFHLLVRALAYLPGAHELFWATLVARVCSSLFNYALNRGAVFRSTATVPASLLRYYLLAATLLLASWGLVDLVHRLLPGVFPTVAKVVVDCLLFLASYQIQHRWVFPVRSSAQRHR